MNACNLVAASFKNLGLAQRSLLRFQFAQVNCEDFDATELLIFEGLILSSVRASLDVAFSQDFARFPAVLPRLQ